MAELEDCDALAPLYHVEGIGLHICSLCRHYQFYLAFARHRISRDRDFVAYDYLCFAVFSLRY